MTDRPCSKCEKEPRAKGSSWGKACLADARQNRRKGTEVSATPNDQLSPHLPSPTGATEGVAHPTFRLPPSGDANDAVPPSDPSASSAGAAKVVMPPKARVRPRPTDHTECRRRIEVLEDENRQLKLELARRPAGASRDETTIQSMRPPELLDGLRHRMKTADKVTTEIDAEAPEPSRGRGKITFEKRKTAPMIFPCAGPGRCTRLGCHHEVTA